MGIKLFIILKGIMWVEKWLLIFNRSFAVFLIINSIVYNCSMYQKLMVYNMLYVNFERMIACHKNKFAIKIGCFELSGGKSLKVWQLFSIRHNKQQMLKPKKTKLTVSLVFDCFVCLSLAKSFVLE